MTIGIGEQIRGEISMVKGETDHMLRAVDGYRRSDCFSPDSEVLLYALTCSIERIAASLKNFEEIAKRSDEWRIVPCQAVSGRGKRKRADGGRQTEGV